MEAKSLSSDPDRHHNSSEVHLSETQTSMINSLVPISPLEFHHLLNSPGSREQIESYKLLHQCLLKARYNNADCVYIEPEDSMVRVRFRIFGSLQEERINDVNFEFDVKSIVQIFGASANDPAQEIRHTLSIEGQYYDIRILPLASEPRQSLSLRLAVRPQLSPMLDELSIPKLTLKTLRKNLKFDSGLFLVTGRLGSKKNETLTALVQELNCPGQKIVSIKNQISHSIPRVSQISSNSDSESDLIVSVLNQAPDIISLDSSQNPVFYQMLLESLTISSRLIACVDANSAIHAIQRLVSFKISPLTIGQSIRAVLHQHPVGRICTECKIVYQPTKREAQWIIENFPTTKITPGCLAIGEGCKMCSYTGFSGKYTIYELVTIDEEMRDAISKSDMHALMTAFMLRADFQTLKSSAFKLACRGQIPLGHALNTG